MKYVIYTILGYAEDPFDGFCYDETVRNEAFTALLTGDFTRLQKIADKNNVPIITGVQH